MTKAKFPDTKMTELHGNMLKERCPSCNKIFWRDFSTTSPCQTKTTNRKCSCAKKQNLEVSQVYFGEPLNQADVQTSLEAVMDANFCLVVGSSLEVNPAATFVRDFIYKDKKVAMI